MVTKKAATVRDREYTGVLDDVATLVDTARTTSVRSVNAVITTTYWLIGRRIIEGEQEGKGRADYGAQLIERLAGDLTLRFGRGFGRRNLALMRAFFIEHREILQTPSAKLALPGNEQTASALLQQATARAFQLPWSHYVRLLGVSRADLALSAGSTAAERLTVSSNVCRAWLRDTTPCS